MKEEPRGDALDHGRLEESRYRVESLTQGIDENLRQIIAVKNPPAVRREKGGGSLRYIHIKGINQSILDGRNRGKLQPAAFNRQIAMYLAKHVGGWSTTRIGRFYNGRDHSTVCYALKRVAALREGDPEVDSLVSSLATEIEATVPKETGRKEIQNSRKGRRARPALQCRLA